MCTRSERNISTALYSASPLVLYFAACTGDYARFTWWCTAVPAGIGMFLGTAAVHKCIERRLQVRHVELALTAVVSVACAAYLYGMVAQPLASNGALPWAWTSTWCLIFFVPLYAVVAGYIHLRQGR